MQAIGGILLLLGLFCLYKMFTARDFVGRGRRFKVFGEDACKFDCGLLAALFLFFAIRFIFEF